MPSIFINLTMSTSSKNPQNGEMILNFEMKTKTNFLTKTKLLKTDAGNAQVNHAEDPTPRQVNIVALQSFKNN